MAYYIILHIIYTNAAKRYYTLSCVLMKSKTISDYYQITSIKCIYKFTLI